MLSVNKDQQVFMSELSEICFVDTYRSSDTILLSTKNLFDSVDDLAQALLLEIP